ncbi:hypothetical protein [Pedobacter frigoris]|uniref:Uncharacterized protein n=1 Tax=Pedobacter frigoris TaxID=2571272 RepID=A0A4V5P1D3_9SPHI|nr:hypothetical protein [Pedobacter frigoris]TKC05903.1 hypothetical protein FA047_11200 [Pedobacter frigoris]
MNMVIFKTSVEGNKDLINIAPLFNLLFGEKNWLFAFEERILRIFTSVPCADVVNHVLKEKGFQCEQMAY